MQAVDCIEVKNPAAFFMVCVYNCAARQRFEYTITTQAVCKHKSRLCYMAAEYLIKFFTRWFCPVYACGNDTSITLDACTDRDIFL